MGWIGLYVYFTVKILPHFDLCEWFILLSLFLSNKYFIQALITNAFIVILNYATELGFLIIAGIYFLICVPL